MNAICFYSFNFYGSSTTLLNLAVKAKRRWKQKKKSNRTLHIAHPLFVFSVLLLRTVFNNFHTFGTMSSKWVFENVLLQNAVWKCRKLKIYFNRTKINSVWMRVPMELNVGPKHEKKQQHQIASFSVPK